MEEIDFRMLYELQDQVLEAVFSADTTFYLTGGTCLHRFYFSERYSVYLVFLPMTLHYSGKTLDICSRGWIRSNSLALFLGKQGTGTPALVFC